MPDRRVRREITPGELYRKIPISRKDFEAGETKLIKKRIPGFVRFCKSVHKRFSSLGRGGKFTEENKDAVEFLGWDLTAEEFAAASKFVLIASIIFAAIVGLIIYNSPIMEILLSVVGLDILAIMYVFLPLIVIAVYLTNYVQTYPIKAARLEQIKALTYVPEIMGYMIMSIKLVPNLEKAIEFSAEHGRGKIAEDFKKLIWDVQLGVYTTLSEALDALAYKWGKFSEEFKHSLMMIRASVIEPTEAKRYALLDKTMEEILDSIKGKMEQYARDLSQPTVMLFYIGVLLPLILIIILPVGSSFSGAPLANPIFLLIIYNILIPLTTIWFAISLIKKRPPTYAPPVIPDNFPGLPPKWKMKLGGGLFDVRIAIIGVLIIGAAGAMFLSDQGFPPRFLIEEGKSQLIPFDKTEQHVLEKAGKEPNYFAIGEEGVLYRELIGSGYTPERAEQEVLTRKQVFFMEAEHDIAPYNLIFGLLITFAVGVFVYLYYTNIYKRKLQLEIMKMESEFRDSLYVLASRMGENKPVEEALSHTKEFLPNYSVSEKIFGKTIDNISLLAMPLEAAVFDPNFGSLKDNPSAVIRGAMRLLIDSVELGVNVAARTMISLSMQLTNQEKVRKMLAVLVSDVTGMMKTMSLFIAPVVLGITSSLQRIVIITLSSIASSTMLQRTTEDVAAAAVTGVSVPGGFTEISLGTLIRPESLGTMATPTEFILIVALYIIELAIIMTYFTTKIEEDNNLLVKINIATFLPISIIVFVITIIVSNLLVVGFLGA